MKISKKNHAVIMGVQCAFAALNAFFIFYQTKLIDSLKENYLQYSLLLVTVLFFVGNVVANLCENYVREREFYSLSVRTKAKAAKNYFMQPVKEYDAKKKEEHLSFFLNEIDTVLNQNCYMRMYVTREIFFLVGSLLTLFLLSWQLGCLILLILAVFFCLSDRLNEKLPQLQTDLQQQKSRFLGVVSEIFTGYHEIHMNQMENMTEEEFTTCNKKLEQAQYDYSSRILRVELLNVGNNMLIYILVIVVGALLALKGYVGIGIIISGAELAIQILNTWSVIVTIRARIKGTDELREKVEDKIREWETEQTQEKVVEKQLSDRRVLVEVENLSFSYEEGENLLLRNVCFSIEAGKKYLITGESGCGKSTLLNLIAGHIDSDVIHYGTNKIVYVPQVPFLFHGTLKENLIFDGNESVSDLEMEAMLKRLNLSLPLDANIEENGKNLSTGQKMRVSLARALLSEPELLILDEVTANLDEGSGRSIEQLLLNSDSKMAVCAVAHRTYEKEKYDRIFEVVNQGLEVRA